jgi:nicotinamide mononucleotide (NMN) deamidase PncC
VHSKAISQAELIQRIHAASTKFVVAVTGGGSRAISALFEVPGASRTMIEAIVPYAAESMVAWLGGKPEHFCDDRTARAMAMAAFQKAVGYLGSDAGPLAGVACTASLASDRPKKGPHRIHVALQTAATTVVGSVEPVKGNRSRLQEEELAAALVLNFIAQAAGLDDRLTLDLGPDEPLAWADAVASPAWQELMLGKAETICHGPSPRPATEPAQRRVIFPGAFNPRHSGHLRMAAIASQRLNAPTEFEISVTNVEKPPLDYIEMQRRTAQFGPHETLWLTRAPIFKLKADLFPGATFVVGADTIVRIAQGKYYGGETEVCRQAIAHIAAQNCRFLVFGRSSPSGFQSLADLDLPRELRAICDEVPGEAFRADISSTSLRQNGPW